MNDAWLDRANASDLEALSHAIESARVAPPYHTASLQLAGMVDGAREFLLGLGNTPAASIVWMLRRLAAERRRADERLANTAQLVWSGISEGGHSLRDTRMVLDGLFQRAERQVLIATYVIYDGRTVFRALTERLRARPGVDVELYVNLPSKTGADGDEDRDCSEYLERFTSEHWPAELPLPAIYYDPETRRRTQRRAALHAKCVVVDQRWALVTSANFTEAAQARNIEAGVLLDHPGHAQALTAQFRSLRESGKVRRMRTGR